MSPNKFSTCHHNNLIFRSSPQASIAGYKRQSLPHRIAATAPQGTLKSSTASKEENLSTFPAPLVLPGDDLALDPTYPPQSLRSWVREKERNKVTPDRRTVYIAAPPSLKPGMEFAQNWSRPRLRSATKEKVVGFPETKDVLSYLKAFYHGLPVMMLPQPSPYFTTDVEEDVIDTPHTTEGKKTKKGAKTTEIQPRTIWLNTHTSSGCIGIRSRATPKGHFTHQLNLNDLLNAAIEILPSDAYALIMLVEHDMFEDEDDEFVCGRAYGGSRVAVVSGARYNPILDGVQGLERDHAWPASHCAKYIQDCCEEAIEIDDSEEDVSKKAMKEKIRDENLISSDVEIAPMRAALLEHSSLPSLSSASSTTELSGLWLGRLCRTASHELGHCFGIDHCVYYSCAMQGTASVLEDARQPPYLCPIDLAKVLRATGADEKERYRSLLAFCEKNNEAHLFAAYAAWIRYRIGEHSL